MIFRERRGRIRIGFIERQSGSFLHIIRTLTGKEGKNARFCTPFFGPSGSVLRAGNLLAASQQRIIFPLAAQWRRLHREHVSRHWICQTPHPLSLSICRPLIHASRIGLTHSLPTTARLSSTPLCISCIPRFCLAQGISRRACQQLCQCRTCRWILHMQSQHKLTSTLQSTDVAIPRAALSEWISARNGSWAWNALILGQIPSPET